jgi:molecular chaperone GrpE (heat shock protein)
MAAVADQAPEETSNITDSGLFRSLAAHERAPGELAPVGEAAPVSIAEVVAAIVNALPEGMRLPAVEARLDAIEAQLKDAMTRLDEANNTNLGALEHMAEGVEAKQEELKGQIEKVASAATALGLKAETTIRALTGLQAMFQNKVSENAVQKEAFDKLYEDMSHYRDDFIAKMQRPLLMSLVRLDDDMAAALEGVKDPAARKAMELLRAEVEETLYRHDVERIAARPEFFDGKTQSAVRSEPTGSRSEDTKVRKVVREGWTRHGAVMRPQEVTVMRFEEGAPAASDSARMMMTSEPDQTPPVDEDLAADATGGAAIGSPADDAPAPGSGLLVEDAKDLQAIADMASGHTDRAASDARTENERQRRENFQQAEAKKTKLPSQLGTPSVNKYGKDTSDRLKHIKERLKNKQGER